MSLQFLYPFVLGLFVLLPLLWRFLRAHPPPPRRYMFAGLMLLPSQEMPSSKKKPLLWLTIFRLLTASLIILAAAHPQLHPDTQETPDDDPPLIIIDEDWAMAHDFENMRHILTNTLKQFDKVFLLSATRSHIKEDAEPQLMTQNQALTWAQKRKPQAWQSDYPFIEKKLTPLMQTGRIIWLTHDLKTPHKKQFAQFLSGQNKALFIYQANLDDIAILKQDSPARIDALKSQARIILRKNSEGRTQEEIKVQSDQLPDLFAHRLAIKHQHHAAAQLFLPNQGTDHAGILHKGEMGIPPLLDEMHYLTRALSNPTMIDDINRLHSHNTIIRPDHATLTMAEEAALDEWIQDGGHLIAFAGRQFHALADQKPHPLFDLIPLSFGELSQKESLPLEPFPLHSPFADMAVDENLTISPHLLLRHDDEAIDTWAFLSGGIPWVISKAHGKGRLTLILTSADTHFSDLVLSETFPELIAHLVALRPARWQNVDKDEDASFKPLHLLGGDGSDSAVQKWHTAIQNDDAPPDFSHPPGLYRHSKSGAILTHNLGDHLAPLQKWQDLPSAARRLNTEAHTAIINVTPILISLVLFLLLADMMIMRFLILMLALFMMTAPTNMAEVVNQESYHVVRQPTIGIIGEGGQDDAWLNLALTTLSRHVSRRTTVSMAEPQRITLDNPNLPLFALLYWRLTPQSRPLTSDESRTLNDYMARGGLLVLDISEFEGDASILMRDVIIPPLTPLPHDHALTRSFYLMERAPSFSVNKLYISADHHPHHDDVTPILVMDQDLARFWLAHSLASNQDSPFDRLPSPSIDGALRFGTNLVLYALTGQYKKDQVHLKTILDRLQYRRKQ